MPLGNPAREIKQKNASTVPTLHLSLPHRLASVRGGPLIVFPKRGPTFRNDLKNITYDKLLPSRTILC